MPVAKKKSTTSDTDLSTSKQEAPSLPDQHAFHEHLRALTRSAVRVVIEEVMREELEQFLGAAWGESTAKRKGYRNGTYTRDLATASGPIEDLQVPRDREGDFHTQMFVAGVSTQKVGEVAETLTGVAPSASTVSRLNHVLCHKGLPL